MALSFENVLEPHFCTKPEVVWGPWQQTIFFQCPLFWVSNTIARVIVIKKIMFGWI